MAVARRGYDLVSPPCFNLFRLSEQWVARPGSSLDWRYRLSLAQPWQGSLCSGCDGSSADESRSTSDCLRAVIFGFERPEHCNAEKPPKCKAVRNDTCGAVMSTRSRNATRSEPLESRAPESLDHTSTAKQTRCDTPLPVSNLSALTKHSYCRGADGKRKQKSHNLTHRADVTNQDERMAGTCRRGAT